MKGKFRIHQLHFHELDATLRGQEVDPSNLRRLGDNLERGRGDGDLAGVAAPTLISISPRKGGVPVASSARGIFWLMKLSWRKKEMVGIRKALRRLWRRHFGLRRLAGRRPVRERLASDGPGWASRGCGPREKLRLRYDVMCRAANGEWMPFKPGLASHVVEIAPDGTIVEVVHKELQLLATHNIRRGVARLLNSGWTPDQIAALLGSSIG